MKETLTISLYILVLVVKLHHGNLSQVLVNTLGTAGFRPACINLLGRAEQLQPGEVGNLPSTSSALRSELTSLPQRWSITIVMLFLKL